MGSSHVFQISKLIELIMLTNPQSVLDIGTGFGKYGFLTREYLDSNYFLDRDMSRVRIDGIEGYAQYINSVHKYVYNEIHSGDAAKIIPELSTKYDLVLLLDVLEHLQPNVGKDLISHIVEQHGAIVVSTPKYVGRQHDENNSLQEHVSQWSRTQLKSFGHSLFIPDSISHIVLISRDRELVQRVDSQLQKRRLRHLLAGFPGVNWIYRRFFWKESIL